MKYWTRAKIDLQDLLDRVNEPQFGGTAVFLGTVRAGPDDGPVVRIEYTAYEAMLDKEFVRIIDAASRSWPDSQIAAMHRLGAVPVGEASIAVVAAAPHRAEAFAACRFVIEEVKKRLPVWKKEIRADGSGVWRPNRVDDVATAASKSAHPSN